VLDQPQDFIDLLVVAVLVRPAHVVVNAFPQVGVRIALAEARVGRELPVEVGSRLLDSLLDPLAVVGVHRP